MQPIKKKDEHDVRRELALARAAREEWLLKWRSTEARMDAVWDAALHEARVRLGRHGTECLSPCVRCWFYAELGKMMHGDPHNYISVKERATAAAAKLVLASRRGGFVASSASYTRGVSDMLGEVSDMLSDRE